MADSWFNDACDLEAAGRLEEAQALIDANTTPEERQALADVLDKLSRAMSSVTTWRVSDSVRDALVALGQDEGFKKYRMAFRDPEHLRSEVFLLLDDLHPQAAMKIARALPAPLRAGRPPGATMADDDDALRAEYARRLSAGEKRRAVKADIVSRLKGGGTAESRWKRMLRRGRDG